MALRATLAIEKTFVILNGVCEPATSAGAFTGPRADAVEGPPIVALASIAPFVFANFKSASQTLRLENCDWFFGHVRKADHYHLLTKSVHPWMMNFEFGFTS